LRSRILFVLAVSLTLLVFQASTWAGPVNSASSRAPEQQSTCTLTVNPSYATVLPGTSVTFAITVPFCDAVSGPVTLGVVGFLPSEVTWSLSPLTVQPSLNGTADSVLTVEVALNASLGEYTINVTARYPSNAVRSAPIIMTVIRGLCDFGLAVEPKSFVVEAHGSKTAEVTLSSIGNCEGVNVSLHISGLPPGVTVTFAPPSLEGTVGGTAESTMSIIVSADASDGIFSLTIVGLADTLIISVPFTLIVSEPKVAGTGMGFVFAIVGIGAGAAVALAGFAVALSGTNYCRFCGNQIPRNSRHCQSCGRRLT